MDRLILPDCDRPDSMTVHDYAYMRLRQAIMVGRIQPGRALTIRGLAEALDMSPTPVREALRRLSSEGAVQVLDNRRLVVPVLTPDRFSEILALRTVLECHAGARACPFITERQIDEMQALDSALDKAIAAKDKEQAMLLNQSFHRMLYTCNPDQMVMPMIESLWLQLGPFLRIAMNHVEELYGVDRHQQAIAALRKRDAVAVSDAIKADIEDGVGGVGAGAVDRLFSFADM